MIQQEFTAKCHKTTMFSKLHKIIKMFSAELPTLKVPAVCVPLYLFCSEHLVLLKGRDGMTGNTDKLQPWLPSVGNHQ